ICGAGDSFSAGAAMALAAGGSPAQAARFGNLVASITIMKKGTGTASPDEVLQANEHARD
ncbi:MAG: PfkB family carbohydrate kinase, partial [Bryobacterales bacterium]|nr:PfkB family carbohydrate kinase [Bryobacterales bacterium]